MKISVLENVFQKLPEIRSAHYVMRSLVNEDYPFLYPILCDKETMKFITPHPVTSFEEVKELLDAYIENYIQHKELPWTIINKQTNEVVGIFRFHKLNLWHRKTEMGVVIRKEYQKKGVMTELLNEILKFGFDTLNLNRIVGDIFAKNIGSRRLLEKFHFTKEGVLRQTDFDGYSFHDTVVYSLLRTDYKKSLKKG